MIDFTYEQKEREMLFSLAKDGDTFYDVGANVGLYSISFAQRFPSSKVYAFEPIQSTRIELINKLYLDGHNNVLVYPCGLSDKFERTHFHYSASDPGATSLSHLEDRFGETIEIPGFVTTIDMICVDQYPPNIIKIDVEGAELLVLRGGARTLEKHKPIIQCEMLRKWTKRFNYHPNEIIDLLGELGYYCYVLRDRLERFEQMTEDTVETNFFFLPR